MKLSHIHVAWLRWKIANGLQVHVHVDELYIQYKTGKRSYPCFCAQANGPMATQNNASVSHPQEGQKHKRGHEIQHQ